ncbi:MAG TPA: B12-binding domain-containing protein [Baekduia sp.]|uniref:cobalamin B12-binding domain-containing protein n=1 Tax=Baekduia sp. TaxID=2600305 RepID=UPI002CF50AE0|nr:B12-binding domain-containing protein [Baekduia sp.]HMJ36084.1 B12-binding domain-containing protein [Baekduia sp.]
MATRVRAVRFRSSLLEEIECFLHDSGQELSAFVNDAVERRLHGEGGSPPSRRAGPRTVPDLAQCAEEYRRALLARDARRARSVVERADDAGADVIDVYQHILRPALEEIGDLWALDEISVAQEHFATEVTTQVMATLAADRRRAPTGGRLAFVGGTPDELHQLGARMVADVLEREGWEVIGLGAATPAHALAELVAADCPDLVALSTSTVGRLPGVEETLGELRAQDGAATIALGGALYRGPVVDLARGWGADIVTSDLRELLSELRQRFPVA